MHGPPAIEKAKMSADVPLQPGSVTPKIPVEAQEALLARLREIYKGTGICRRTGGEPKVPRTRMHAEHTHNVENVCQRILPSSNIDSRLAE